MFMEGVWRCMGFARAKDLVRTLWAIFHRDAKFGFWVVDNIFEGRGDGGFYDVEFTMIVLNLSALFHKDFKCLIRYLNIKFL